MRTEEVTCDGCGADLTTRTNSVDYRLVLASESKPGYGSGAYTLAMIYPPVERAHHFCGLDCLDHWRARENFKGALRPRQPTPMHPGDLGIEEARDGD